MGADLTYQCLGGNTYKITLSFYRDCIGIAAPANPFITIRSASCSQNLGVTCYPRPGTGQEVTPACSSSVTTCNGGSFTGIQEWVYDGIVTLPVQCTDWVFSYSLCCRNAAITNISNPGTSTFFIYATLNNTIACNSSPTFSNKPVPFLCLGQQYCFNHGAYDTEGDSLVYQLITPFQTAGTTVNYIAPFSSTNPLSSSPATSFNTVTGDICMTPTQLEVTVMAVNVLEYRNGVLIGSVERDLQLTVMNCNNNLPSLTGINGTNNFSITICANEPTCFDIFSNDPDAGQNLTVSWDAGIPGATFNTNSSQHPTGTFCWTPDASAIGNSYQFTATVMDDACPYMGSQVYSYTVNVIGISVNAGPDQQIACSDLATLTASAAGGSGTYTYLWSNGSTMQSITVGSGTYWVTANDGTCTATDTVVVTMPFIPNAAFNWSTPTCLNSPIQFMDQSTTPAGIIIGWNWDFGDGSNSAVRNPTHQYGGPGTYNVSLVVENNLGCLDTVVHTIVIAPPPVAEFSYSNSCVNSTVTFTDLSTPSGNITGWNWTFGDGGTSTLQNPTHIYTSAGTYTVTLTSTDSSGCTGSITHNITIHPLPAVSAGPDQTICAGGSVTLTASGGNGYSWNPGGGTNGTIVVTPTGTTQYVALGTDSNGCQARDTVQVIVNPLPVVSAGPDPSICTGNTATLTASGASTYTWMPGNLNGSTIFVDPVSTTNYTVIGTGPSGCTNSDIVTVHVGTLPSANAGPDVTVCAGASATLTASGGATYSWSPTGDTTSTISVNPGSSTTYYVTVTDSGGCSATDDVEVTVNNLPVINLPSFFLCSGSTATLDAGNPGSTYTWSPGGQTTQTISVNTSGTYTVTVTSPAGCTASSSATITVGNSLNITIGNVSFCQGDSAVLDAGYPGMSYNWTTGDTTQTITVSTAGSYGVTVTDTSGCSGSITVTAQVNAIPVPNFSATSVCFGNATSFTDASTVIGSSINSWSWDFGDSSYSQQQNPVHTFSVSGYQHITLSVTSTAGCSATLSDSVRVNPLPVPGFTVPDACAGTGVLLTNTSSITGGNITAYSWNFGDGDTSNLQNPVHPYSNDGTYTITLQVTTAGGCVRSTTGTVTIHPVPVASFSSPDVCTGTSSNFLNNSTIANGTITGYSWDFGDSYTSTQTAPSHLYPGSGTYTVTLIVGSALGCTDTVSNTVTVNPLPAVNAGVDRNLCRGSSVTLAASGGISYSWLPGGISGASITVSPNSTSAYTVVATNSFGCSSSDIVNVSVYGVPSVSAGSDRNICIGESVTLTVGGAQTYTWNPGGQTTASITLTPLSSVTYYVTGIDANGCQNQDTIRVNVNPLPQINAGTDQDICLGSTIALTATGGVSYSWNPGGSTSNSILITPSSNTNFVVLGTDINGCQNRDTVSVTVNPVPVVNLAPAFVCSGYTTTLDAGNPGASYSWSTGESSQVISVSDSGIYTVIVTNNYGCSVLGSVAVSLSGTFNGTPTQTSICSGQSTTLSAGNNGSTYQWSTNQTTQSIIVSNAGTYTVTVTDNNGCSAVITHSVTVHPLPVALFSAPPNCLGQPSVFTSLSQVSSDSIQSYNWNFGDSFSSLSQNPLHTYTTDGSYNVALTVTTDAGCTATVSQNIIIRPLPTAVFTNTVACQGQANLFTDSSTVISGTIVNRNWNFGDNTFASGPQVSHQYANPGTYQATLIITTQYGCSDTITGPVNVYSLPSANFVATPACAQSPAVFTQTATSSQGTITGYQWSFGDGSTDTTQNTSHVYSTDGNYTVSLTVISSLGCMDSVNALVSIHPLPQAAFSTGSACAQSAVGFTNQSGISSGSISNNYWAFGDNSGSSIVSPSHVYALDGNYPVSLVVTSDFGCRDTAVQQVPIHPLPTAGFSAPNVCAGSQVEFLDSSGISTGSIASWNWTFGDGNTSSLDEPVHTYQVPGTYTVMLTVTSVNGCSNSVSEPLNIFPNPVAAFSTTGACVGSNNTFINQSSVSGGIGFASSWDLGDGSSSSITNPVHNYLNYGTYNVTLTVTTAQGCTDQNVQPASVYRNPTVTFDADDVCLGIPVQFIEQAVANDGFIVTWDWTFGDGGTSNESRPLHQYANPGSYNVNLITTTTYGCAGSYSDSVMIHARPAADIHAVNACQGVPVQFSSASPGSSQGVTYQWDFGNGFTSTDSSLTYQFNNAGTFDVTLVATNQMGCSGTDFLRVEIYPLPATSFDAADVCQGSTTVFNNLSTISSGQINSWSWNFGDLQSSTQYNPRHDYQSPGTYTVALMAVSDHGCVSSTNEIVRINPNPVVSFGSGMQGCAPLSTTFQDHSLVSSGNIDGWLWNFGDGNISTDQHPVHEYTSGGQYNVTLTVVSDAGCQASYTQNGIIRVFGAPVADFTADPLSADNLSPSVHFINLSQGFTSYMWTFGDGFTTGTELNPVHTFQDTGTYTAMLVTVNAFGCRDTALKLIEVKPHSTLYVPNCFTPNGDGKNEVFKPEFTNMEKIQVWIFDRWGKLLTNWDGLNGYWDGYYQGRKCQSDVYVYKIKGLGIDGQYSEWVGHVSIVY